jgi:hypothetical protein
MTSAATARGGGQPRLGLTGTVALLALLGAAGLPAPASERPAGGAPVAHAASLHQVYAGLPLRFEPNVGQADPAAQYVARGAGYTLLLGPNEALLALRPAPGADAAATGAPATLPAGDQPAPPSGPESLLARQATPQPAAPKTALRMQLGGANATPAGVGEAALPGVAHYYLGNDPAAWRTNVPTYRQVRYRDVYDGVDLVYYGSGGQLEYDFVLAPGADPSAISLRFPGADAVTVDAHGDLVLGVGGAEIRQRRPVVYQEIDGERQSVAGSYVVYAPSANPAAEPDVTSVARTAGLDEADLATGTRDAGTTQHSALNTQPSVGFALGAYDRGRSLVIDPVLVYSTYLGGSAADQGNGISLDGAGNAYVTGTTASTNFPTFNGSQLTFGGGPEDAFVAKLNASGTVVYSTYLGGSNDDQGLAIAADASGNAYVAGYTQSSNFPTTAGAFDRTIGPESVNPALDGFVAKLSTTGALAYSTFLGGNSGDIAYGIAVDSSGNAYVTGETVSTNFPIQGAVQPAPGSVGTNDAFVTKLNATGSAPVYSTYLGGSGVDRGRAIAVDSAGNAYVTGETYSSNFPTLNAAQATYGGGVRLHCGIGFSPPCADVFVTKLNAVGNAFVYSTYLGGDDADLGKGIAVDSSGNAYVTGRALSTQFPRTATFGYCCGDFVFVTRLGASGALGYSVLLGGQGETSGQAIAVDGAGSAYVTGYTRASNFPTQDPLQATLTSGQGSDVFVTKVNSAGSGLVYSTYLGGSSSNGAQVDEAGYGIAVDGSGNAYVAGFTQATDFPTRNPWQPTLAGSLDAFVTKLNDATPTPTLAATSTPSPTLTSTPTPTATITPTPTATLLPVNCTPRPSVSVTTAPGAPGSLRVTVAASGANNLLLALRFGEPRPSTNEQIDVGGQTGRSGAFTVTLPPPGVAQTTFTVRRATAGQATTASFTVADRCGDWPTLAGGGPSAF